MAERRSLIEGIKPSSPPVDVNREQEFVYGEKTKNQDDAAAPSVAAAIVGRSPISTRIRADFAVALKKASLERQLYGKEPHTLQDILEQAIEPWLKSNGYMP